MFGPTKRIFLYIMMDRAYLRHQTERMTRSHLFALFGAPGEKGGRDENWRLNRRIGVVDWISL